MTTPDPCARKARIAELKRNLRAHDREKQSWFSLVFFPSRARARFAAYTSMLFEFLALLIADAPSLAPASEPACEPTPDEIPTEASAPAPTPAPSTSPGEHASTRPAPTLAATHGSSVNGDTINDASRTDAHTVAADPEPQHDKPAPRAKHGRTPPLERRIREGARAATRRSFAALVPLPHILVPKLE